MARAPRDGVERARKFVRPASHLQQSIAQEDILGQQLAVDGPVGVAVSDGVDQSNHPF